MLDPIALAQAGPVAILLVGIGLLGFGFVKGYVVPGWLYRQERDARILAETRADKAIQTATTTATVVEKSIDARPPPTGV